MGPVAETDGYDGPGLTGQLVPGVATQGDDLLIGVEDAIGEPVLEHELPDGCFRLG